MFGDHSIKAKKPPGFREADFFRKVMTLLERRRYRLPVRRFVIDLFEKTVKRRLVLEEDDADSDDNENDDNANDETRRDART